LTRVEVLAITLAPLWLTVLYPDADAVTVYVPDGIPNVE
jgi:hypothetical protein